MSQILRASDVLSGQEGNATANINGSIRNLFAVKNIEATIEKLKTEVKGLGKRGTQNKAAGWSGTGSMTMYYMTSDFRKMMIDYIKTGRDTYFSLTITNDDPSSTVGKQTIVLYNCNIDSVVIGKLDVDSEVLDEEVAFTFDDVDILDQFGNPVATA